MNLERMRRTSFQQTQKERALRNRNRMNAISKIAISFVSVSIALIPFWIWLTCYKLLSPTTFWEKLVVYGLGAYLLGAIQLVLLIVLLVWLYIVWND